MKEQSTILPAETAETRKARVQRIAEFLARLPVEKPWEMIVRPYRRNRSSQQNRALFGHAYEILSDFTGHSKPELHEVFCREYFGEVRREVMGTTIIEPRRTTTTDETGRHSVLTTVEFSAFYEFVERKAAELGCYIPSPDPEWWRHIQAHQGREAA